METWKDKCIGWQHDTNNIKGFFDEFRFLSNFHVMPSFTPIYHDGMIYESTEAAYMASKTLDKELRKKFQGIEPREAKKLGREIPLREDWEEIKDQIMYEVNYHKYSVNEELKQKLLTTGDRYLEETNWWGDRYWGVCNGEGRNQLGKTLMRIRSELRNPVQMFKKRYLAAGYTENWGDGAINQQDLCILSKHSTVQYGLSDDKVKVRTDYVVISANHNPVHFYDVGSYSC